MHLINELQLKTFLITLDVLKFKFNEINELQLSNIPVISVTLDTSNSERSIYTILFKFLNISLQLVI